MVNAKAGATVLSTGDVRDVDGKGRHTTTHRELSRWKQVHRAQRARGGRP